MGTCERRFRSAFFIKSSIFQQNRRFYWPLIVLRESFIDPILAIERHFHLKSDTWFYITRKRTLDIQFSLQLKGTLSRWQNFWKNQADFFKFGSWVPGGITMIELFSASLHWHCIFYQNWTSICRFPLLQNFFLHSYILRMSTLDSAALRKVLVCSSKIAENQFTVLFTDATWMIMFSIILPCLTYKRRELNRFISMAALMTLLIRVTFLVVNHVVKVSLPHSPFYTPSNFSIFFNH